MGENRVLTLIVVRSDSLREGVEALLASIERIDVVERTGRIAAAMRVVAECPVDLLLIEAGLPKDAGPRLLAACRREHPGIRSIVLADDGEQAQEARASGADAVLLKGFPADRFVRTVERLLPGPEGRSS
jgi:DNA-binding NarL/FixJ family response regulator